MNKFDFKIGDPVISNVNQVFNKDVRIGKITAVGSRTVTVAYESPKPHSKVLLAHRVKKV